MIQRIQTVYLLIVAGLFISLLFLPLATLQSVDTLYSFDVTGVYKLTEPSELIYPTWSAFALTAIIAILSLITIFMFKKRILQIRICIFNSILIIGFCALFTFYLWQFGKYHPDMQIGIRLWVSFPVISVILNYLAIRNIGADEVLVRSLERLR